MAEDSPGATGGYIEDNVGNQVLKEE